MTATRQWPGDGQPIVPESADELAGWVKLAGDQSVSLGGTRADYPVDFSRLTSTSEWNPGDMVITAGVGLTLGEVKTAVAAKGLWLPLDSTAGTMTPLADYLGGDQSMSWLSYRHGTARDWVMGMSAVDDTGTQITWGAKVVKNVAGYQLGPLYIGSRHTLGLMVEVTMRLIPMPTDLNQVRIMASSPGPLVTLWRNTVKLQQEGFVADPWEAIRIARQGSQWQLDGLTYAPPGEIESWIGPAGQVEQLEVTPCNRAPDEPATGRLPVRIGRFLPGLLGTDIALDNWGEEELIIYPAIGAALFFDDGQSALADLIEAAGGWVVKPGDSLPGSPFPGDDTARYMRKVKSMLDPHSVFGPAWEVQP